MNNSNTLYIAPLPEPRVEITSDTYTVRWLSDEGAQRAMITWRRSGTSPVFTVGYVTGRGHGAEVYDVGVRELARYVGPDLLIGCDQGVSLRAARRWDVMVAEGSVSWTLQRAGQRQPARLAFGPGPVGSGSHDWWHEERARRVADGTLADLVDATDSSGLTAGCCRRCAALPQFERSFA